MAKSNNQRPTLYGTVGAAHKVGVSESTMLRYAKTGVCQPIINSSGRHQFTQNDIKAARKYRSQ